MGQLLQGQGGEWPAACSDPSVVGEMARVAEWPGCSVGQPASTAGAMD